MELVKIFIAGGVFCMFGEILWAKTGLGVVKTLMVCIAAGVALDVAGILGPVIGFGQEGFTGPGPPFLTESWGASGTMACRELYV